MHPTIREKEQGRCPLCGMKLVEEGAGQTEEATKAKGIKAYWPLIVVVSLLLLVTVVLSLQDSSLGLFAWPRTMSYFMAGFFLVFSGFKLLDLKGFAQGYSTYDLLAKRVFSYGYLYPFIELSLGLCYILFWRMGIVNVATLIVMGFSGLGVLMAVMKRRQIQCACLGTIFKLPLTNITLVEDFGMALMAGLMLLR